MPEERLPESLLEMHYFRLLVRHYRKQLGITDLADLEVFKPSTTNERWFGFDQGYFRSAVGRTRTIADLRAHLAGQTASRLTHFRAFFLQFKVVQRMQRRSSLSPDGWYSPYLRAEVDLADDEITGMSQHETLRKLSTLSGATVQYACPMIFTMDQVVRRPRLRDLRFVDVSSSPDDWDTDDRHFIAFQDAASPAHWCSRPAPAKEQSFDDLIRQSKTFDAKGLFALLNNIGQALYGLPSSRSLPISRLPESLTIIAHA